MVVLSCSSSTSSPAAQPVLFETQLQNLKRKEGESASLRCKTTKPGASVVWRFGDRVLASSSKYHLKQEGTVVELVIYKLRGADSGEYSCDAGNQRTSAVLSVQGRSCLFKTDLFMHPLESLLPMCPSSLQHLSMKCINLSSGCPIFTLDLIAFKYSSVISHPTRVLILPCSQSTCSY